jgi:hypothetical protein
MDERFLFKKCWVGFVGSLLMRSFVSLSTGFVAFFLGTEAQY